MFLENPEDSDWGTLGKIRGIATPGPLRILLSMLGCPRNLGSMVRINGLFHLLINGVYWGYNLLILTIDPNFQRDIQVGNLEGLHLNRSFFPHE